MSDKPPYKLIYLPYDIYQNLLKHRAPHQSIGGIIETILTDNKRMLERITYLENILLEQSKKKED